MAEVGEAMLAGLPDRARRLLAEPPAMEKRLIELSVTGGLARMAAAARLFVITWDPLESIVHAGRYPRAGHRGRGSGPAVRSRGG
jgi:hypothetical protein